MIGNNAPIWPQSQGSPYEILDENGASREGAKATNHLNPLTLALPSRALDHLFLRIATTRFLCSEISITAAVVNGLDFQFSSKTLLASTRRRLPSSWILVVLAVSGAAIVWQYLLFKEQKNTDDDGEKDEETIFSSDITTISTLLTILGTTAGAFIFMAVSRHNLALGLKAELDAVDDGQSIAATGRIEPTRTVRRRYGNNTSIDIRGHEANYENVQENMQEDWSLLSIRVALCWQIYVLITMIVVIFLIDCTVSRAVHRTVKHFGSSNDDDSSNWPSSNLLAYGTLVVFLFISIAQVATAICLSAGHFVAFITVIWTSVCAAIFTYKLSVQTWHFVIYFSLLLTVLYLMIARPHIRAAKASFLVEISGRQAAAHAMARMSQKANPFDSGHLREWSNVIGSSFSVYPDSTVEQNVRAIQDLEYKWGARIEPWNVSERFLKIEESALPLAGGAVGQVFRALYHSQPVAVKEVFATAVDRLETQQLSREVEILASLSHPRIVQLFGLCKLEQLGKIVVVMEFLPRSLAIALQLDCMKNEGTVKFHAPKADKTFANNLTLALNESDKNRILIQVVEACLFLERLSIAHRDLKPGNVLLTSANNAKLCDFGSAIRLKDYSEHSNVEGTAGFTAPEVLCTFNAEKLSPLKAANLRQIDWIKADIYSVGMCLAAMFSAGGDPYPSMKTATEVKNAVLSGLRPLHFTDPIKSRSIPQWAIDITTGCWVDDPIDRPTFAELERRLLLIASERESAL